MPIYGAGFPIVGAKAMAIPATKPPRCAQLATFAPVISSKIPANPKISHSIIIQTLESGRSWLQQSCTILQIVLLRTKPGNHPG